MGIGMRMQICASLEYPLADRSDWWGDADFDQSGGHLVRMSPDEYLWHVRPLHVDDVSRENIDDLKAHIEAGGELDPTVIYADGREDGRHRAHAAKELGISSIPVIDFRSQAYEPGALLVECGSQGYYWEPRMPDGALDRWASAQTSESLDRFYMDPQTLPGVVSDFDVCTAVDMDHWRTARSRFVAWLTCDEYGSVSMNIKFKKYLEEEGE